MDASGQGQISQLRCPEIRRGSWNARGRASRGSDVHVQDRSRQCTVKLDSQARANSKQPLRALHYIKLNYPRTAYETAFHYFFYCLWTPPNLNLTVPETFAKALSETPSDFRGAGSNSSSKPLFSSEEVDKIVEAAKSQEVKDLLTNDTQEALDRGAFGTPWLWVRNSAGKEEPFFGSDRYVWAHSYHARVLMIDFILGSILCSGS